MSRVLLPLLLWLTAISASAADVAPVPGLSPDFMLGADISTLDQVERQGGRFRLADGREVDPLKLLQAVGVNWIRLRLWHDPVFAEEVWDGQRLVAKKGEPVGGGNNGLDVTVRLAKRAKALGLKFLLDIHYSDFWTDPSHQRKPVAWAALKGEALQAAVHDHTAQALRALEEAGAYPDMIQAGNEVNGGFLWPEGKTWQQQPGEEIGGTAGFHALLKAAITAVREADARRGSRLPVVIHLANGGDNALFRRVFDPLVADGVDFDVIGLSYYPYLHGTIDSLKSNLADLATRYRKPLVVVETASGFTLDNGDATPNLFGEKSEKAGGYPATVAGQATAVRDVIAAVAATPGGLGRGVFYWEPLWIPVAGAGWRTGDGNGWENQAMVAFDGRVLPSLRVFQWVRGAAAAP
jgi:arabinogalactan endo-1,4-beta-galactosidase